MARAEFPAESLAVRGARAFVLDEAGLEPADAQKVALAVSELAANAVLHAQTPFVVTVRRGPVLRVEVADGSTAAPIVKHHSLDAPTGRGLRILGQLVDRWDVEVNGDGKKVWFELDIAGADR